MTDVLLDARPEVEFDADAYPDMCDVYRHADGSITYIVRDHCGENANPREDENIATLVQRNDRCVPLDTPDDQLLAARSRWAWMDVSHGNISCVGLAGTCTCRNCRDDVSALLRAKRYDCTRMIERYIAMFRPDVIFYDEHWSGGDSYGWGYITHEAWMQHMVPHRPLTVAEAEAFLDDEVTRTRAREVFDAEVKVYGQWASGEVYGAHHVTLAAPIVVFGDHGAYVDGYETSEESCWGFLGHDDNREICGDMTNSPVTEVLG